MNQQEKAMLTRLINKTRNDIQDQKRRAGGSSERLELKTRLATLIEVKKKLKV